MERSRVRWSVSLLVLMVTPLAASSAAWAADCAGETFDESVIVGGQTLVLNGLGIREATVLNIDVYVAGLYLPTPTRDDHAILHGDTPYYVEMRMMRDISREDIVESFTSGFHLNAGLDGARYTRELEILNGWVVDAHEGDVATYTYVPGTGLEVRFRGALQGVIEGSEFAHLFLGVWIGPNPPDEDLKNGMLGGECT